MALQRLLDAADVANVGANAINHGRIMKPSRRPTRSEPVQNFGKSGPEAVGDGMQSAKRSGGGPALKEKHWRAPVKPAPKPTQPTQPAKPANCQTKWPLPGKSTPAHGPCPSRGPWLCLTPAWHFSPGRRCGIGIRLGCSMRCAVSATHTASMWASSCPATPASRTSPMRQIRRRRWRGAGGCARHRGAGAGTGPGPGWLDCGAVRYSSTSSRSFFSSDSSPGTASAGGRAAWVCWPERRSISCHSRAICSS